MNSKRIGILITNTGTPDAPTPFAVWKYLQEFLLDKRVVQIPRWLWWPLLHAVILPRRCFYSAKLYQKIWTPQGSPMRFWMEQLVQKLQDSFLKQNLPVTVALGMHYGKPSIDEGLKTLRQAQVEKIIVLPLFPQYSSTTTAATFDKVAAAMQQWTVIPEIRFIQQYADNPEYILALSKKLQKHWRANGRAQHVLFSFHGIPEFVINQGDPYPEACRKTAELIAAELDLSPDSWSVSFQSRFGYARWVTPYTNEVLQEQAKKGVQDIDVICPGFSVDCLETLEEIAIRARALFLASGGRSLRYVPALNADDMHIQALTKIVSNEW